MNSHHMTSTEILRQAELLHAEADPVDDGKCLGDRLLLQCDENRLHDFEWRRVLFYDPR